MGIRTWLPTVSGEDSLCWKPFRSGNPVEGDEFGNESES